MRSATALTASRTSSPARSSSATTTSSATSRNTESIAATRPGGPAVMQQTDSDAVPASCTGAPKRSVVGRADVMRGTLTAFRSHEAGGLAALGRQLDAETLGQALHVLPVDVVEVRVHVPTNLQLGRDARDVDVTDA